MLIGASGCVSLSEIIPICALGRIEPSKSSVWRRYSILGYFVLG